jgi:hypothetical protein
VTVIANLITGILLCCRRRINLKADSVKGRHKIHFMKKLFLVMITGCMCTAISSTCSAQTDIQEEVHGPSMESSYTGPATPANVMDAYRNIDIRAVRNFKTTFKNIDNEEWCVLPNGYRATFTNDGIVYFVTYSDRGHWMYTKRQYDEAKMDRNMRGTVKSVYYDYHITLVEDIEQPAQSVIYLVHMEDKNRWKNIQFYKGEMKTVLDATKL